MHFKNSLLQNSEDDGVLPLVLEVWTGGLKLLTHRFMMNSSSAGSPAAFKDGMALGALLVAVNNCPTAAKVLGDDSDAGVKLVCEVALAFQSVTASKNTEDTY